MGQNNSSQNISSLDFSLVREVPNGAIVKQNNGRLHFVKEYTFTNQQAYQQAFVNFSKKLPEKHEHILFLQRTNTKLQNTFCSTFFKICLIYQYLDQTLQKQIQKRIQEHRVFDQKQVWSVLCSCTLAVSQMIRFQGRCHAALKTKDLRLTQEGVVKILSLQMVGIEPDQDPSLQGTVKQLAITILNCILMDQISNDSQFFLNEIIDNLQSSDQMKNVLRLMLNPRIKFVQLQQYLFKLVQEDTDSLNSYSNTPILKQKAAKDNSYSRIPQQSKQDDNLFNMPRDIQDNPENKVEQYITQQQQIPDQNDAVEDSKALSQSQSNTLRDKNIFYDSVEKLESSRVKQTQFSYKKNSQNLFTDPKLLNLIHSNLEQINKRKSISNSRKLVSTQSKGSIVHKDSKTNLQSQQKTYNQSNTNTYNQVSTHNFVQQNTSLMNRQINTSSNNQRNQIIKKQQNTLPLLNNSSTKTANRNQDENMMSISRQQTKQLKSSMTSLSNKNNQNQSSFKNQKYITSTNKLTSQDKKMKIQEIRYDNIMDIKDMGFKKNKNTKITQQIRQSKEPKQIMHHVYHNNQSSYNSQNNNSSNSSFNYNTLFQQNINNDVMPLSNTLSQTKSSKSNIMYSMNQSKQQFQYVTQTYLRGKYEGTKLNNMRHGSGVFYYIQGGKYIGQWKQNKMNGKGVLYYPDNSIAYEGEWKDDQLSGYGTLYNQQVKQLKGQVDYKTWRDIDQYFVKYQGDFKEDSKNGKGRLYLSNGQVFQGNFKDDMIWGQGMLTRQDGIKMRGMWRQNKLMKLM